MYRVLDLAAGVCVLGAIALGLAWRLLLVLGLVALFQGCALSHTPEASRSCWTSGTVTPVPDRDRCFDTFDECTQDAVRWGAGPWACEGVD